MKKTTVKILLMSILMLGFYSQVVTAQEEDACESSASTVKANWGQFIKYASFGAMKLFLAHKLYTVAKEGYDKFKTNCGVYQELRQASVKINKHVSRVIENPNIKNVSLEGKLGKANVLLEEVLEVAPDLSVKEHLKNLKEPWKNILQWNNIVGSLIGFVGIIDLYNCFKIARAMYNKEKTVKLEINLAIK